MIRLQRFLAQAGVASRRGAEELIRQGRVKVNGKVAKIGQTVSESDKVELDGHQIRENKEEKVVIALNKPRGFVTTKADEFDRQTVYDLLPKIKGLHSIGRLDLDSEGLIIFTNDGDLTLRLSHPRYGHLKTYQVITDPEINIQDIEQFIEGIELEDGFARAEKAVKIPNGCLIVLSEGRKRQVRRMIEALGLEVIRLKRIKIGNLSLGELKIGEWKQLDQKEIDLLLS